MNNPWDFYVTAIEGRDVQENAIFYLLKEDLSTIKFTYKLSRMLV